MFLLLCFFFLVISDRRHLYRAGPYSLHRLPIDGEAGEHPAQYISVSCWRIQEMVSVERVMLGAESPAYGLNWPVY